MNSQQYFKVTNRTETHFGYQYHEGVNILPQKLGEIAKSNYPHGFYFTTLEFIPKFYDYGCFLREIILPDSDPDFEMIENPEHHEWSANKVILGKKYFLNDLETYQRFNLPYPRLAICAQIGSLELIQYWIDQGADPHENDEEALSLSIREGHFEIVKFLIGLGANIHIGHFNHQQIEWASGYGHLDIVKYLVGLGADIHVNDESAFRWACSNNHLDVVRYLVELGADIHVLQEYALRWSLYFDHYQITHFLIKNGANIDVLHEYSVHWNILKNHLKIIDYLIKNNLNSSDDLVLKWFVLNNHLNGVKLSIESGSDIHADDNFALKFSAEHGYLEIIEYLVEKGIDLHLDHELALQLSAQNGHLDVVQYLVESGSNFQINNHLIMKKCIKHNRVNIIKYLIEKNNHQIKINDSTHLMSRDNCLAIVKFLFENETNDPVQIIDYLEIFYFYLRLEIIQYLIEKGVDFHQDDEAVLRWSASKGDLNVVQYLIELGADFHVKNEEALRISAKNGYIEIVKYLVEKGARIDAENHETLRNSLMYDRYEISEYLKSKGCYFHWDLKDGFSNFGYKNIEKN